MDWGRLANVLSTLGLIVTALAVYWWANYYNSLIREFGDPDASLLDAVGCLYSQSGVCGFVTGIAQLAGKTPYEPMLFWIGVILLVAGVVMKAAKKRN